MSIFRNRLTARPMLITYTAFCRQLTCYSDLKAYIVIIVQCVHIFYDKNQSVWKTLFRIPQTADTYNIRFASHQSTKFSTKTSTFLQHLI